VREEKAYSPDLPKPEEYSGDVAVGSEIVYRGIKLKVKTVFTSPKVSEAICQVPSVVAGLDPYYSPRDSGWVVSIRLKPKGVQK
jgi:hypothetical protein